MAALLTFVVDQKAKKQKFQVYAREGYQRPRWGRRLRKPEKLEIGLEFWKFEEEGTIHFARICEFRFSLSNFHFSTLVAAREIYAVDTFLTVKPLLQQFDQYRRLPVPRAGRSPRWCAA